MHMQRVNVINASGWRRGGGSVYGVISREAIWWRSAAASTLIVEGRGLAVFSSITLQTGSQVKKWWRGTVSRNLVRRLKSFSSACSLKAIPASRRK